MCQLIPTDCICDPTSEKSCVRTSRRKSRCRSARYGRFTGPSGYSRSPSPSGGGRLRGLGDRAVPAAGRDLEGGTAEEVALPVFDAEPVERRLLLVALDPLGDQRRVDAPADRGEARDDLALDRVLLQAAHERVRHLDV